MATTRRVSIERVLCPIDFSDTSHHALAHAAAMAYEEWIAWHWHVMLHQRGVPLS